MTFPDIESTEVPKAGKIPIPRRFVVYDSRNPIQAIGLGVKYPNGWTSIQWRVEPEANANINLTELAEYTQPFSFKDFDEFASKVLHIVNWVD